VTYLISAISLCLFFLRIVRAMTKKAMTAPHAIIRHKMEPFENKVQARKMAVTAAIATGVGASRAFYDFSIVGHIRFSSRKSSVLFQWE